MLDSVLLGGAPMLDSVLLGGATLTQKERTPSRWAGPGFSRKKKGPTGFPIEPLVIR